MDDRSKDGKMPDDRKITPERALLLAAFDQWLQLVEHRAVTPVKLLRREPTHVEREQAVELAELSPGRSEHALKRLDRLAALRLGTSHRLDDESDCVLHNGVEKSSTCWEVNVDRGSDNACPASDLRHAAVGIARERVQACVEDGRDAPVGICPTLAG
jgi:hypothetical protein